VEDFARLSTPFNRVVMRRVGRRIDMEVEGATFATYHPHRYLTGFSWDAITAGTLLGKAPKSILLLGLAGGTSARQLRRLLPGAKITAVEIDPALVGLARAHMDLDALELDIAIADADRYVGRTRERFDVVIDDLYRGDLEDVARVHALWGRRLERLQTLLRPGGRLVANFITDGEHDEQRVLAAMAFTEVFGEVSSVLPPNGLNEILVGGTNLGDETTLAAYTQGWTDKGDIALWGDIRILPPA
jgi:SAM-dependent methyltransferase